MNDCDSLTEELGLPALCSPHSPQAPGRQAGSCHDGQMEEVGVVPQQQHWGVDTLGPQFTRPWATTTSLGLSAEPTAAPNLLPEQQAACTPLGPEAHHLQVCPKTQPPTGPPQGPVGM